MTPTEQRSMKSRVLGAGSWVLAGYAFGQILRFGSNLIMTRVLVPDAFGVMAVATVIMIGLGMFSDLGLKQSVVKSKRGADPAFLNTAWTIQIVRGAVLCLFALGISVLLLLAQRWNVAPQDSVYDNPQLPSVVAAVSATAFIAGFESTKTLELHRGMWFARLTQIDIAAQVAGLLLMLVWATLSPTIWALVASFLCAATVRVLLSHAWLPGERNQLNLDGSAASEIIHFGKWIFLSSILGFFVNNGDRLLVGAFVDTTLYGVFTIAVLLYGSLEHILSRLIADVCFPAISETARERPADLQRIHYKFAAPISLTTYFCAGSLMACGSAIVALLFDYRYMQAGWMLEILAVGLIAFPFRLLTQTFLALGNPHILTATISIRLVALASCVPTGAHLFGMRGALWGIVISHLFHLPFLVFQSARSRILLWRAEVCFLPAILAGFVTGKLVSVLLV